MINIAIVEDDATYASTLSKYIDQYASETDENVKYERFADGLNFLMSEKQFDIVFMDIEMPVLDGMTAAKKLRLRDKNCTIIFVTNNAGYAIKGYEADAMDFLVKPVEYLLFTLKMEKAIKLQKRLKNNYIVINSVDGYIKVDVMDIFYIETDKHYLIYKTVTGDIRSRDSLKNIEPTLLDKQFFRCNNSFLVNMAHVNLIKGDSVLVGAFNLPISRSHKKQFMDAMMVYFRSL
ncbi:MAG: LytTR family DNA-binding domain-containing protein [Bacilli bacterium]|nr:LytTR family DNA-binding domain-containing protein [Bacilli bacterium]